MAEFHRIIIDTDTAGDDAAALIIAAKNPNIEILGVTVLAGNVSLEQGAKNALAVLELIDDPTPVYMGASTTFSGEEKTCFSVFGADGMGEADLIHPRSKPQEKNAVDFILETVRANPGEIEIVALGPATNLALAVRHIDGLLIHPGETFSVWKLVGRTTRRKGYKEGLTIAKGQPSQGIGGGLCQLSNLIHWLVLHSELTITEHHHHDGLDLFPDFGRQIPFGTGTSISYNYIDYRVRNDSANTYQLRLRVDDEYLCGELRATEHQPHTFHIHAENEFFSREDGVVYRNGEVYRDVIDCKTGQRLESQLIRTNHAMVMYDCPPSLIRP